MPLADTLGQVQRAEFLRNAGWAGAHQIPIHEDQSQRKFFRIDKGGKTAILMQSVPDDDPRMTPGHRMRDFVRISEYLIDMGLSAPEVYSQDLPHGLLLVEDFGTQDFATMVGMGEGQERDLYLIATSTIRYLYRKTEFIAIELPDYYASYIHKGHQRVIDWYFPAILKKQNDDQVLKDYLNIWKHIEKKLPRVKRRMILGDYHPGNMVWLPERQGIRQTGILDFQQAMMGPAPYDLVNLLEDARREVPQSLKQECLDTYTEGMLKEDKESFLAWYPVLATQFHCRIIGQAIRLAIRDRKTKLLSLLPVLQRHIIKDLENPELALLKEWFKVHGINFLEKGPIDIEKIVPFIRQDAH